MATKFLARPLQALDRLYRFLEGQAPFMVELTQPIQVVHDVSRQAELGAPGMGLFLTGLDLAHAGSDTQEGSWDPYAEVAYLYPNASELLVWLLDAWVTATSTTVFNQGALSIGYAPWGEWIPRRDRLIVWWDGDADIFDQNVAPATLPAAARRDKPLQAILPTVVPPGSTFRVRMVAGAAAGTIRTDCLCWAGPIGARPPGW